MASSSEGIIRNEQVIYGHSRIWAVDLAGILRRQVLHSGRYYDNRACCDLAAGPILPYQQSCRLRLTFVCLVKIVHGSKYKRSACEQLVRQGASRLRPTPCGRRHLFDLLSTDMTRKIPKDGVELIPWNFEDKEHLQRIEDQRLALGWFPDFSEVWKEKYAQGRRFMYWIVSSLAAS